MNNKFENWTRAKLEEALKKREKAYLEYQQIKKRLEELQKYNPRLTALSSGQYILNFSDYSSTTGTDGFIPTNGGYWS